MDNDVVVLGFYNRNNIGDDAYMLAFPLILQSTKTKLRFFCLDDIQEIPAETQLVICGGGDIINDYFMTKARTLLKSFAGRVYALSVGIPYESCAQYLNIFDHVFTRSQKDYTVASKAIGYENVTYIPDAAFSLPIPGPSHTPPINKLRVGMCLAQSYFANNTASETMIKGLTRALKKFYDAFPDRVEYHFFAFNYFASNIDECDHYINQTIYNNLSRRGVPCFLRHNVNTAPAMLSAFAKTIEMTVCMRYHSVVFSLMTNKRFVPLYVSQKVQNLLTDVAYPEEYSYPLEHEPSKYKPTDINETRLLMCLKKVTSSPVFSNPIHGFDETYVDTIITKTQQTQKVMVKADLKSFNDVYNTLIQSLSKFLGVPESRITQTPFPVQGKDPLQIARFICFIISGRTNHPCVWGLTDKLETPEDFDFTESVKFIWDSCRESCIQIQRQQTYYPTLHDFNRRVLLHLDYLLPNDFAQYHRSGWSYVIGGLMNLDASHLGRNSDIMLDTYVDRSFHWGYDILKHIGVVSYDKPWYGFIHHTFDETHSEFNCVKLFQNQDFIKSLDHCKGLFALSNYLANQLRNALNKLDLPQQVPVHILYHPMEFVTNNFTMTKFLANPNKSVVQIGAWLRNPYAIYELPLAADTGLQKVALKGKEMDQYFPPANFLDEAENLLIKRDWTNGTPTQLCGSSICRDILCRPDNNNSSVNKYCQGLFNMIVRHLESVKIVDRLSNDDYDKLLSENIVFLYLVDCSAVNTVIECVVRGTVLIVNRQPALEEILGENYPGFYDSLKEAADMCADISRLTVIANYLTLLDKERYKLENFIENIQQIVQTGSSYALYDLMQTPPRSNMFFNKYANLLRYLPTSFHP